MRETPSESRRNYLKKVVGSVAGGSAVVASAGNASASSNKYERQIEITEHNGTKVYYGFNVVDDRTPTDVLRGGKSWAEAQDDVDTEDDALRGDVDQEDYGNAWTAIENINPGTPSTKDKLKQGLQSLKFEVVGAVQNETDTYTIGGQVSAFVLFCAPDEDFDLDGSYVTIDIYGWEGPSDLENAVKIAGDASPSNKSRVSFYSTGEMSKPGNGSLESDDSLGDLYANSYVDTDGLQDQWNFKGRPSYLIMEPGEGERYLMFNRYINASW
ncbi:hypothetical protein [Haloarcula amylolytica]|uniref:hypothetical protein n=1 Tax=Haloarcula amylolytica TaxID=396317 RepID=UPI0012676319|nr:hypothetical protein [Haloarcula amylolytica]